MLEPAPLDAHPHCVRRAPEPLSSLCQRQPRAPALFALGERLLNASLHQRLELGMRCELRCQLVQQPVRPCGAHAALLASTPGDDTLNTGSPAAARRGPLSWPLRSATSG